MLSHSHICVILQGRIHKKGRCYSQPNMSSKWSFGCSYHALTLFTMCGGFLFVKSTKISNMNNSDVVRPYFI